MASITSTLSPHRLSSPAQRVVRGLRPRALGLALFVLAVATTSGQPVGAEVQSNGGVEQVEVRSARHDGYARLVLDWGDPVAAGIHRQGTTFVLTADRPFDADFADVTQTLAPWVDAIHHPQGSSKLRLKVGPKVEIRRLAYAPDLIVLDFLDPDGSTQPPEPIAEPEVRIGEHARYTRLVLDWGRPNRTLIDQQRGEIRLQFDRPGRLDLLSLARRLDPVVAEINRTGDRDLRLRPRPAFKVKAFALEDDKTVIDFLWPESTAPAVGGGANPPIPEPRRLEVVLANGPHIPPHHDQAEANKQPQELGRAAEPIELALDARRDARGFELVFTWSEAVPAAVFVRAGMLWTVFGAIPASSPELPVTWSIEALAHLLGPGERVAVANALALRFPLLVPAHIQVAREQATWHVRLGPEKELLTSLDFSAGDPQSLAIRRTDGGRILELSDPTVGDRLGVWPLLEPAGIARRRMLVHLEILPSAQGVVWRSRSDRLQALADKGELVLAPQAVLATPAQTGRAAEAPPSSDEGEPEPTEEPAETGPDHRSALMAPERPTQPPPPKPDRVEDANVSEHAPGLPSTTALSDAESEAEDPTTGRGVDADGLRPVWLDLARFATPAGQNWANRRVAMMEAVFEAPAEHQRQAELDLARFLIANDLSAEAVGVLRVGDDHPPDNNIAQALTAATDFLSGRIEAAAGVFSRTVYDGDPEIALWRAASAAELGDWELAETALRLSRDTLATYPLRLRHRLGLPAAWIYARAGRVMDAFAVLDGLKGSALTGPERREVEFTRGLVYRDTGAIDAADTTWRSLEAGARDRSGLEAALARRVMLVDAGRMPAGEALSDLHPLRPAWRGLADEANQLATLADLGAAIGRVAEAIRLWQEAAARGVDPDFNEAVGRAQRGVLVEALLESGDAWIGPLRAYGLFKDFHDLLPRGRAGAEVRRGLAARLASIDQIDPAAQLLQEAIATSSGAFRAELGAELASLWLNYPDPGRALDALDASAEEKLPHSLERERALLRARAWLGSNDQAAALDALTDLDDQETALLRAEILWAASDWQALQPALAPLIEASEPGLPDDERRRLLVELALALWATGDRIALARLAETYSPLIEGTAEEAVFQLATTIADSPARPAALVNAAERKVDAVRALLKDL